MAKHWSKLGEVQTFMKMNGKFTLIELLRYDALFYHFSFLLDITNYWNQLNMNLQKLAHELFNVRNKQYGII